MFVNVVILILSLFYLSACFEPRPNIVALEGRPDAGAKEADKYGDATQEGPKNNSNSTNGDKDSTKTKDQDPKEPSEPAPIVINDTGGALDNNAVEVPIALDDNADEIDPFKGPRMLISENTKNCLDLDQNSNRNGEVIQGRPCSGGSGQMLEFKKHDDKFVSINFFASKGCWKLEGGSLEKRTIVEQWKCADEMPQLWAMERITANTYAFHPAGNAMRCIDMDTNGPAIRSTIQIYDCNGSAQQSFRLIRKDKAFKPLGQPVLSLDDMCHQKIRVYEDDSSASGKLVYETLGGRFMDRIPEYAKMVCHILYDKPEEVLANITYLSAYIESDLPESIASSAKPNDYKRAEIKFSAKNFQSKANDGYDIALYLKGRLIFSLAKLFQNDLKPTASGKLKALQDSLSYALQIQAGYADKSWKRVKTGSWDQGGLQTGIFLSYLETLQPGFLKTFNKKFLSADNETVVATILGKGVDELWTQYQQDASCGADNLICKR